jgi:hypothetical protein
MDIYIFELKDSTQAAVFLSFGFHEVLKQQHSSPFILKEKRKYGFKVKKLLGFNIFLQGY